MVTFYCLSRVSSDTDPGLGGLEPIPSFQMKYSIFIKRKFLNNFDFETAPKLL